MKSYKSFLLLLTFVGFLWGCETTDPFVNEVQLGLVTGDYEMALETVNEALEADPENGVAHYYKGLVLGSQAESIEDPVERKSIYEESRASMNRAQELMEAQEDRPSEYEEMQETITAFWANEYNSGVNILTEDSVRNVTPDPNWAAIAHFENAATIQPDSALTFQVLSSTYYNEQEMEMAISTYEEAMRLLEEPEIDDYEYLISLYLMENEFNKAIDLSEEAMEAYPDESVFVQYLADAYIQSGDRDRAISIVENLIAEEPDNPQYRRVLGTQIYQSVDELNSRASDLYEEQFEIRQESRGLSGNQLQEAENRIDSIQAEIKEIEAEIDELVQISTREMERVVEMEPDDESAHFILGIIYQNHAANLFERRNNTTDHEESAAYDEEARENLREALVYYERAAELNPDDPEYWQSLFQVYTTLGMEEEAREAMEKADF
ncbi:MAG: tetratricopeptide repeat protein [Balneolaceae bacterium]